MIGLGHEDKVPGRDRELRGQAGALTAQRVLGHLHNNLLALVQVISDIVGVAALSSRPLLSSAQYPRRE